MCTNNKHKHWQPATVTIHGGKAKDEHGALVSPLYQTATFAFANTAQGSARFAGEEPGYIYSRLGNPTITELEQRVAALEDYPAAAATATGMGAVSAAMLAFLQQGDHVLVSDAIYGCSFALFSHLFTRFGIEVSFVDMADLEQTAAAMQTNTKLVFLESPVNPHLKVIDIAAVAAIAHAGDAKLVVDNTFMTPLLQQPRRQGADLVLHSATKYLNGHGDVVAGIVCGSAEDIELIKLTTLKDMGATMSPHDAWLILRGLKTLDVRMQRHCENAQQVAEYLRDHAQVREVYYPGFADHPAQQLMGTQMHGAGAVIAFELCGDINTARQFLDSLQLITIAVSLGDAETLIQHPASMTHSPYTPEARAAAGITDTLVRISVGLEAVSDILSDLEQAFTQLTTGEHQHG
ncbi:MULTISPECIES: methionine gamma-lyase [Idiomarina]|uniref:methionine gamma-lyase n=1 Tax=Idiomarina TaxID=135575 RepID=UPI00129B6992|nr:MULTISPECIES: methionine gamma-lyase [Idiomarina]MRJ40938.1 methionine gamma-lyase [Idiomarina sp. FeN1]NCU56742.1 methionine gamma-lyase [Idiomarina sp. FenA--70]NCU59122.1 methionine gamma-lyase [Idiomarina sp. FenBw--71]UUN14388.1 methionine gamma-lyase [Idiomarina loihiensis]